MYKVVKLAEASRTISGIFLLFPPSLFYDSLLLTPLMCSLSGKKKKEEEKLDRYGAKYSLNGTL